MKKHVKGVISALLLVGVFGGATLTAVACGNDANTQNSNGQIANFQNAPVRTVSAMKYFGQQSIGDVLAIFQENSSNPNPNAPNSPAQVALGAMGYNNATIMGASLGKDDTTVVVHLYLNQQGASGNQYQQLNLVIQFTNPLPTPTTTESIISAIPNATNQWPYIFSNNNRGQTPTQITPAGNNIVSQNMALNDPAVQLAYQCKAPNLANGILLHNALNMSNVLADLDNAIRTQICQICTNWNVLAPLQTVNANTNVSLGGPLSINGDLWWQITNPTPNAQSVEIGGNTFSVPAKGTIACVYKFANSPFDPALFPTRSPNVANLGYKFRNATLVVQVNQQAPQTWHNQTFNVPNSISINTQVMNVSMAGNPLREANSFTTLIQNNIQTPQTLNGKTVVGGAKILASLIDQVIGTTSDPGYFWKGINSITALQPILQLFAQNVSLIQFLQNCGQNVGQIIDQWLPAGNLGNVVANLFSQETISEFIYNTTDSVVALLQTGMKIGGEVGAICSLINEIYQMNFVGKTEAQITNLITNISSMNQTVGILLNNAGMGPSQIVAIKALIDDLASNENFFTFFGAHIQFIEGVLKTLISKNPLISKIFAFVESIYIPPTNNGAGSVSLPDGILSIPILNLLTNTGGASTPTATVWTTQIKTGLVNLLQGLFPNPPPLVTIILDILGGQYPNWTVQNLTTFLNGIINLPVTATNGTPLPRISSLSGYFNSAISAQVIGTPTITYDSTTDVVSQLNLTIRFAFTANATLSFATIFQPLVNALSILVKDKVASPLLTALVETLPKMVEHQIQFFAGESVTLNLTAHNAPLIPVVENGQLGWTLPMMGGWQINLFRTINSLFTPTPNNNETNPLTIALGALGVDLDSVIQTPFWSQFQPIPLANSESQLLNNYDSDVAYQDYQATIPTEPNPTILKELWTEISAITPPPSRTNGPANIPSQNPNSIGGNQNSNNVGNVPFTKIITYLNTAPPNWSGTALTTWQTTAQAIKDNINTLFDLQLFQKSNNPLYQQLNPMGSALITPVYEVMPVANGNQVNCYKILVRFPIPISDGQGITNSLTYTIQNPNSTN